MWSWHWHYITLHFQVYWIVFNGNRYSYILGTHNTVSNTDERKGYEWNFQLQIPFLLYLIRFSQEHAVFCIVLLVYVYVKLCVHIFCCYKSRKIFGFIYHNVTTSCSLFLEYVSVLYVCIVHILSTINFLLYCSKHLKDDVFILCVSLLFFFIYFCILFCIFSFLVYILPWPIYITIILHGHYLEKNKRTITTILQHYSMTISAFKSFI